VGLPVAASRRGAWATVATALLAAAAMFLGAPPSAEAQITNLQVTSLTPPEAARAVQDLVGGFSLEATRIEKAAARSLAAKDPTPSLSNAEVLNIAEGAGRVQDWVVDHPVTRTTPDFDTKKDLHTVWYVRKERNGKETVVAQVMISDETGKITEQRAGPQVAWMMARGYDGAFGRAINRPAIWIALCTVFFLALISIRRLMSWRTLDLLVLLSFSVSLIWFNRGEIFTSVPLAYPPMIYLMARLGWIGLRRTRPPRDEESTAPPLPLRPTFTGWAPTWVLVTALATVLGLRYGLNAFNSNVIDVGYAGVIGADRITDGATPYGTFPSDCGRCDTYGPLAYLAYVPLELTQPWTGSWDSLPAAHGAATLFDILCVAGMLVLGWNLGGIRLGMALAVAWAAYPFTVYALSSNSNDALVPAMLIWGLVLARRPLGRGLMLGLAVAAKFGPAILVVLWARSPFPRGRPWRGVKRFAVGVAAAGALTGWVLLLDGLVGVRAFWSRTLGYQFGRDSPFSIWGQYPGLRPLQLGLTVLIAVAAIAVARWPRRLDLLSMIALSGALLIATQLTLTHWFYLYIPWFLPFVLVALVPQWPAAMRWSRTPIATEVDSAPEPVATAAPVGA
jgi:Glycosyltransferase family 87